ncbi:MAG: ATP-dependent DNA helicase RecG [Atopobiaceae bacterium]|nr:ATP-dependent DNA helicase RecG [Atopobiaceae bacterium]
MGKTAAIPHAASRLTSSAGLSREIESLRYVSGGRAEALRRMGIHTIRDLLFKPPLRYLDFTHVTSIAFADVGSELTVLAQIQALREKRPKPRLHILELDVSDGTELLRVVFFRQPWLAKQFSQGDWLALSGKIAFSYGFKEMNSPLVEKIESPKDGTSHARILPIHHVSEGLSVAWMRRIVSTALTQVPDVCDYMPADIVSEHSLMGLACALRQLHFPNTSELKDRARRRLAYDELLCLQLAFLLRRNIELEGTQAHAHPIDGAHLKKLAEALPFELSDEQITALSEILGDMTEPRPMSRLLLGDVGTGKTAVAALAMAAAVDGGSQAVLMAPTSVLAAQHAASLGPLFDAASISWALLTGATDAQTRQRIVQEVAAGTLSCVFGTTALLSDELSFEDLGLVVIDEQHRFGVGQRSALRRKGLAADVLMLSATPIPRTLALTLYGDMECSRIKKRPRLGAGVITTLLGQTNADIAFAAIHAAVSAGQQAYVVCPLVRDGDDTSELEDVPCADEGAVKPHAAIQTARILSERELAGLNVGLIYGQMTSEQKDETMQAFREGQIDVLVATTVIEVGVDVPNATVMMIYDAERFGLATLHQLRGRVGRGDKAGEVYLLSSAKPESTARARLSALERSSDGFELAELDLQLRHEGEVLGYRQHGGPSLSVVDLEVDRDLVEFAHRDARRIAQKDYQLTSPQYRPLAHEAIVRFGAYFEEVKGL